MKRLILVAVVVLFASSAIAQQSAENYIQVNGVAEKEITPDEIYLSITLDESDSKGRVDIATQRNNMIASLKSLGIDVEKSLTIADMSSNYIKRKTSFVAAKYQLCLSSSEQVLAVYDALEKLNISNIDIVRVSHSKIEQFKSNVRKEAMQNARQVASELAEAVGQSVGSCIYIYDSNRDVVPALYNSGVVMRAKANLDAVAVAPPTPIEFKKIKLSYSVSAKFELNR